MKTLITSGCSYTSYNYKTWADYLGENYDKHLNLGKAGSGPRYSHNKICDYLRFDYNKDHEYTFIIQWSSLIRVDFRKNDSNKISTLDKWSLGGQVNNNDNFNPAYIKKYFNIIDRASDLLMFIEHIILLSKHYNFKLYMLYMFEPWLGNLLGEPCGIGSLTKHFKSFNKSKYKKELEKLYFTDYFIQPSIETFCCNNEERDFSIESHPTTNQHKKYADMIVEKYLN